MSYDQKCTLSVNKTLLIDNLMIESIFSVWGVTTEKIAKNEFLTPFLFIFLLYRGSNSICYFTKPLLGTTFQVHNIMQTNWRKKDSSKKVDREGRHHLFFFIAGGVLYKNESTKPETTTFCVSKTYTDTDEASEWEISLRWVILKRLWRLGTLSYF